MPKKTTKKVKETVVEKVEVAINPDCKHQNQGEGKCFDCGQIM